MFVTRERVIHQYNGIILPDDGSCRAPCGSNGLTGSHLYQVSTTLQLKPSLMGSEDLQIYDTI